MPRDYSANVPIAIQHKDDIISRLASGETATSIAHSYGLKSHSSISNVLADDPEYIAARINFHSARLDNIEGEIRESDDMLTLARVKELATMYRWRAERECRDLYGKDSVQSVTNTLNVTHLLLTQSQAMDILSGPAHEPCNVMSKDDRGGVGFLIEVDSPPDV